jgi:hypothetical protein
MALTDHPTRARRVGKQIGGAKPKPKRSAPAKRSSAVVKTSLLRRYDELVEAIEHSAASPTWRLADWLVTNVPNDGAGRPPQNRGQPRITMADLAKRDSARSERWLQTLRATAEHWPNDKRVAGASLSAHELAFRRCKSLDGARKSLMGGANVREQGGAKPPAAAKRRVRKPSAAEEATIAADVNDDKAEERDSDFETLREILWFDLDEAKTLASELTELDEDQSRLLHQRATELREVADWLDGLDSDEEEE